MASKILVFAALCIASTRAAPADRTLDGELDFDRVSQMIASAQQDRLGTAADQAADFPRFMRRSNISNTTTPPTPTPTNSSGNPAPSPASTPTPSPSPTNSTGNQVPSPTAPSPSAPPTANTRKQVVQTVTFSGMSTLAENLKPSFNKGYGKQITIYDTTTNAWAPDSSVNCAQARRVSMQVTFTSIMTEAQYAGGAQAQLDALGNAPAGSPLFASLADAIMLQASNSGLTINITVTGATSPVATTIQLPTTSGTNHVAALGFTAIASMLFALTH